MNGPSKKKFTCLSESLDKDSAISHGLFRYIDGFTDVQSFPGISSDIGREQQRKHSKSTPAPQKVATEKFRVRGPLETETENVSETSKDSAALVCFVAMLHLTTFH